MAGFDDVLPRDQLVSAKWDHEVARTGNPDILCFGTADMDFRAPGPVVAALRRTVETGFFGYPSRPDGYYEAITAHFGRRGWDVHRDSVLSHVGIYPSLQVLLLQLTEPGDEVVLQPPVHHVVSEVIGANGRRPVENPLRRVGDTYVMDLDDLAARITDRTRVVFVCNPHNPVGRVWSRAELTALADLCLERGVLMIADEIYHGLVHEGVRWIPLASLSPEVARRTITLGGASKSFNLTGLKHSLVIAEAPDLRAAYADGLRGSNLFYGGSLMGVVATEAAFTHGDAWLEEVMAYVAGNRALLADWLAAHPEVIVATAEGTYFAWLDCRAWGLDDAGITALLDRAGVAMTSGLPLGTGGSGHLRLNLACPRTVLAQGLERLATALSAR